MSWQSFQASYLARPSTASIPGRDLGRLSVSVSSSSVARKKSKKVSDGRPDVQFVLTRAHSKQQQRTARTVRRKKFADSGTLKESVETKLLGVGGSLGRFDALVTDNGNDLFELFKSNVSHDCSVL